MEKTLKKKYEELAEEYRKALIKQFYPNDTAHPESCYIKEYGDSYWVGYEIGGVLELRQDFYDYDTIRYIVDNDVKYEEWESWYQYCQTVGDFDIKTPTLDAWCKGCPVLSQEQIERLAKMKEDLKKQIEEDKQFLKGGF